MLQRLRSSRPHRRSLIAEAKRLITAIEPRNIANLRDRAIIGIMGQSQASIDTVISMQVRDYYLLDDRQWLRLRENGIERHTLVDRQFEPYIGAYLAAAGITNEPESPLFRVTLAGAPNRLSAHPIKHAHVVTLIKDITALSASRNYAEIEIPEKLTGKKREVVESSISNNLLDSRFDIVMESINSNSFINTRDRAIMGLMLYASLTPNIISTMLASHYKIRKSPPCIELDDPQVSIAAPPPLVTLMQEYLSATQPRRKGSMPLFGTGRDTPMTVADIQKMIRQRLRQPRSPRRQSLRRNDLRGSHKILHEL